MVDDNNLRLGQTIFRNNGFERLGVQICSHCGEPGRESLSWGEEISEEKVVDKVEEGLEIKVEEKSGAKGLDKEADQEAGERVEQKSRVKGTTLSMIRVERRIIRGLNKTSY
jgi:hypothetical protein